MENILTEEAATDFQTFKGSLITGSGPHRQEAIPLPEPFHNGQCFYEDGQLLPLFVAIAGANPMYIGTPLTLEHAYPGLNLHHLSQASALIGQPLTSLYQFGNFDQLATLSKGLLASQIGGEKPKELPLPVIPAALGLASPEIFQNPLAFPLKKEMEFPEKSIAGALIKNVPKVSKLPISVALSPKGLELSTLAKTGILGGGLTGASILPIKSSINALGIPYGF